MTEYKFTANYQLVEEQPIIISFDELHKELYDRGWTVHWEFNGGAIDPALLIYNDCITVEDCATVNPEYAYDVDGNGAWNYRLDNLENADAMFVVGGDEETDAPIGSPALVSFNADLPKVTMGMGTFAGCSNLTTFNGELSNLSECQAMFANCPKLKSFTSDLSNLTMGPTMFGCNYEAAERLYYAYIPFDKDFSETPFMVMETMINSFLQEVGSPTSLDIASVQNIANTINDISNITPPDDLDPEVAYMLGRIDIGIDPTLEGNSDIEAALTTIRNKGWDVTPMYGSDSAYVPTPGEGLLKYNNCKTYAHCKTIDANVATDVKDGAWNYRLDNLRSGGVFSIDFVDLSTTADGLFLIDSSGSTPNTSLVSFNVDLPNLTNGTYMFAICPSLTSFSSALPNLRIGMTMFAATALTSFSSDLPKLIDGTGMFAGCTNLTSFNSDLPKLTCGLQMFSSCTNLTSFNSDLSSLINGDSMFGSSTYACTKLNLASVQNIANTINDLTAAGTTGKITIGISSSIQDTPELETALAAIVAKGWIVEELYA